MATYQRGLDFPNEGFVQTTIEEHFRNSGCHKIKEGYADLVCISNETNEKWIIEAKGETTSIGLDFRTGLGQLLQQMDDPKANYAIAVPNITPFLKQCHQVPKRVRIALNIYILLIDEQGKVQTITPQENIEL